MIEDEELRGLFAAEADEYLHHLEQGLLAMDREGPRPEALEEVFRQAHSLKGSARMLGVRPVELATHGLESRLDAARKGRAELGPGEVTLMLSVLDGLRRLVREAVTGEDPGVAWEDLLETLGGAAPAAPRPAAPPPEATSRRDFLRVRADHMDVLLEQAGELVTAGTRLEHRLRDAEDLLQGLEARRSPLVERAEALVAALREDVLHLGRTVEALDGGLREARLAPAHRVLRAFPRMVRELSESLGKEVELRLEGGDAPADRGVLDGLRDSLVHLVRNAVDHGLEPPEERLRAGKPRQGLLTVAASRSGASLVLEVRDDGRGLDLAALRAAVAESGVLPPEEAEALPEADLQRLAFSGGLSTRREVTDVSGWGVGLSVVREQVAGLKGRVEVDSAAGAGCRVRLTVPASLSWVRVLLVRCAGQSFGLPLDQVEATRHFHPTSVFALAGSEVVVEEGVPVPVVSLARLLDLDSPEGAPEARSGRPDWLPSVRVAGPLALAVDDLLEERELAMKPLGGLLHRVRHVLGACALPDGDIALLLDVPALAVSAARLGRQAASALPEEPARPRRILLAEDSLATRVQVQRILEAEGYEVVAAVDGWEALEHLGRETFDAVVSDLQMPRVDGFALLARIRQAPALRELPVILLTTLGSEEDRRRGLEAGADAYLPKQAFRQDQLLDTLRRLL